MEIDGDFKKNELGQRAVGFYLPLCDQPHANHIPPQPYGVLD